MMGDDLVIFFGSNRNGPGPRESIFTAVRASPTVPVCETHLRRRCAPAPRSA